MSGDVSDDLIPQLLEKAEWRDDVHSDLHRAAATALEAKEAEIAALKERLSEQTRMIQNDHDLRRADISRIQTLDARLKSALARAETAERKLTRERETFQRHEQTLRDNGIASHSEAVVLVATLRQVFDDILDQLGCERDNEAALEAIATLRRKLAEARAALKAFLPDPTMMDILWGGMDDEATGTHTIKLKHFRAARAVIEKE